MTIMEAIAQVDSLVRNTYSQKDKVGWLSRMDHMIKTHVIDGHEGAQNIRFAGYDDSTDLHTVLLVPPPFDEIYLRWMEAQIHYHNGEYDRYNAAITMYNTAFEGFRDHYTRNHRPLKTSRFLF